MSKSERAILYSFYNVLGTFLAATGASDIPEISDLAKKNLSISGNAFQAAGSAAAANLSENAIEVSGDSLQAMGNSLVIYKLISYSSDRMTQRIGITGNWFQALGGSYALQLTMQSSEKDLNYALTVTGNLMQIIGNALQALSGAWAMRFIVDEKRANAINMTGSWIQALGAFVAWLALVRQQLLHACQNIRV